MTAEQTAVSPERQRRLQERLARAAGRLGAATVRPRSPDEPLALSYAQERLWFMEQYAPGTTSYHIALRFELPDADPEALRDALQDLTTRHETLRTRFPADADGTPSAVIEPPGPATFDVLDVDDPERLDERLDELVCAPFDLARGPLLTATLLRVGATASVDGVTQGVTDSVVLRMHHIIGDGWSTEILLQELVALYHARCGNRPANLPALPVQYADFASWQRRELESGAAASVEYWRNRLSGVVPLDLPTDHPRPARQRFDGGRHTFTLEPALLAQLRELARAHDATLYMCLLAAWQATLSRCSGQYDLTVGTPVAGRNLPEVEGLVGMFVNMLVMRADLSDDPTFSELLRRTRADFLETMAHADVPFEHLVQSLDLERDTARPPLFQVMFALQNYEMGDLSESSSARTTGVRWNPVDLPSTRFELELHAVELPEGLRCALVFSSALFSVGSVARLAERFVGVLGAVVGGGGVRVSGLPVLVAGEGELVVSGFNATGVDWSARSGRPDRAGAGVGAGSLPGLLAAGRQVAGPGGVAVVSAGVEYSYGQVDAAANRVADRLAGLGVGGESVVGVCAGRSVELVVALLGVVKAGAAFLPLDPGYPPARLGFMVADAGARVVLTQQDLTDTVTAALSAALSAAETGFAVESVVLDGVLDGAGGWAGCSDAEPAEPVLVDPEQAAYVIYTSGSTGQPKAVVNTQHAIVNRLAWMQDYLHLAPGERVLQKTPTSFDVSVWEFFWPLATGATVVMARPDGHKDPTYLRELIQTTQVSTCHFVPSMLTAFLADLPETPNNTGLLPSLTRIVCSGEALPAATAATALTRLPHTALHNLYGPTEAAIDVTATHITEITDPAAGVSIGAPIANTQILVLDHTGQPQPIGVTGHLHIAGHGLARGYHARPGMTADRFTPNPYGPPGSRLYNTGDLARWRPDGTLDYLGRTDHQVKLRGQRIELGEIETALRGQPDITDAAVILREDTPGDQRLTAYITGTANPHTTRTTLATQLPEHLIPTTITTLPHLPTTPNGKLDRTALPQPTTPTSTHTTPPRTPTEHLIATTWAQVLTTTTPISAHDNFFDLGGHSLLATKVVARLRTALQGTGRSVSVIDLFTHRTVEALATFIDGSDQAGPRRLLHELTKPVPPAQRAMSLVCVPYGGGSAVVYQPLADALPPEYRLFSVAIPGHDVGLDEEALAFDELAERCTEEILERVDGPLALYGHCGVGGALVIELARRLEAAGRALEIVYTGAVFPFARPSGLLTRALDRFHRMESNRHQVAWLKSLGVDMDELDAEQADRIVTNMREDSRRAEALFSRLLDGGVDRLAAPIVSVIGDRDVITDYYMERYREWHFLTDTAAVAVLPEAGHFFLKYRADELAEIVSSLPERVQAKDEPDPPDTTDTTAGLASPDRRWRLAGLHRQDGARAVGTDEVKPSMRRFLTVTAGQLVSMTGTALTLWALPIWLLLQTDSLVSYGLLSVLAMVPGLLVLPVAGAVVDRSSRRRVMAVAGVLSAAVEAVMAVVYFTVGLETWHAFAMIVCLSLLSPFQRVAFMSAIPQLVPKHYLGHANGVNQVVVGAATLVMPLLAAGALAVIGLGRILLIDVLSYAVALTVLALVRFPATLGAVRREPLLAEVVEGFRYLLRHRALRATLVLFSSLNVFLAVPMILVVPVVLSFGDISDVGVASSVEALGALLGGIAMGLWGGPVRRRMVTLIGFNGMAAVCCILVGLRPDLVVVLVGVFGIGAGLSLAGGIYYTIIQVKVPQRFHGRVLAINQAITWAALPIGYGLLAPFGSELLEPLMQPGGALAPSLGALVGTGEGRGMGAMCLLCGLAMLALVAIALRVRVLSRFDTDVPDSVPDDLLGAQAAHAPQDGRDRKPDLVAAA